MEYPQLRKLKRNYVRYICTKCLDLQKKNEYLALRKFNGKLCTLYIYGMSGFVEKLNIPNTENSTGNCVHYLCTACLDLQKN